MTIKFDNPSNLLIYGQKSSGKNTLVKYLTTQMDYSDLWIYAHQGHSYANHAHIIDDFAQFINNIVEKRYVSDCLMVVVDHPKKKDVPLVQKLLQISDQFDIYVIIVDCGQLRKNQEIMGLIDYECIFHLDNDVCQQIKPLYEQLKKFDFILLNKHEKQMTIEHVSLKN